MLSETPVDGSLSAAARALRRSLIRDGDDEALIALIDEAARAKDRLDKLHTLIAGDIDAWAYVYAPDGGGGDIVLKIDAALAEQRQLATVFRQLLADIYRRQGDYGGSDEEDGLAGL